MMFGCDNCFKTLISETRLLFWIIFFHGMTLIATGAPPRLSIPKNTSEEAPLDT
jgi:hypothetical protein